MKPSPGQLIALKAVLLGHAAALNPIRMRDADAMVCGAIRQLTGIGGRDRQLQLAFYHLVRAELRRVGGDPVADRDAARHIARKIRSDVFRRFMEYERATEHLLNKPAPSVVDPHPVDPPLEPWRATISDWSLTEPKDYFIHKATLAEILDAHGLAKSDS